MPPLLVTTPDRRGMMETIGRMMGTIDWSEDNRKLKSKLAQLQKDYDEEMIKQLCSCCLGNPISGKPCICKGTGTQEGELQGFREELFDNQAKLSRCHEVMQVALKDLQTPLGVLYKSDSDWKGAIYYLKKTITALTAELEENHDTNRT
jgi:hypothetical protein